MWLSFSLPDTLSQKGVVVGGLIMVEGGHVISRICMHSLLSLTYRCMSSFTFKVDILCFIFAYQFFIYNLLYLGIVSVSMYIHMCTDALVCASSRVHV